MVDVMEQLMSAMNSHDASAVADLFATDYRSEQPLHPNRGFGGGRAGSGELDVGLRGGAGLCCRSDLVGHRRGNCMDGTAVGRLRTSSTDPPGDRISGCERCSSGHTGARRFWSGREAPEPHAGPGQVRIAVRAASVNPIDWKTFSGAMSGGQPMAGTGYLGCDAAGVVDEVGEGVTGVSVGDDVFGRGEQHPGRVRRAGLLGGQAAVGRLGGGGRGRRGR